MTENYDVNTAKTYAMVGLVFYSISTFVWLLAGILGIWVMSWASISWGGPWYELFDEPVVWEWGMQPVLPWFIFAAIAFGFLVSLVATAYAYMNYKKINEGQYADARTSSLVLGIFGLFPLIGSFIGGIFYFLAYWKLGEVLRGPRPTVYPSVPGSHVNRFCVECGRVVGPDNLFCAHCGAKLPG